MNIVSLFLRYRRAKRPLETHLTLSGTHYEIGPYHYCSFDAGNTWHNVEVSGGVVRILGPANEDHVRIVQKFDQEVNSLIGYSAP